MQLPDPVKPYAAKDTGKPPHILTFQIAARTKFVNPDRELICAVTDCLCHIHFTGRPSVLRVTNPDSVNPHGYCG